MKNRTVYRSSDDVFRALYELDYDLSQLNLKSKIHLTIFGGTALLLMTEAHVTKDIDAFIQYQDADNRIRSILAKYSVNDKMRGVMELPPLDEIIATTKEVNGDFENLIVRLPSTEHLVISKLFVSRQTDKDVKDIINSGILSQCNIDLLRDLYDDYKEYTILPLNRYNDLDEVLELWVQQKQRRDSNG